jgi:hypothetical protein
MNQELAPLLVELYLEHAHIVGICRDVRERRRLIDVLNHQDEMLDLEDARVSLGNGVGKRYESILINKASIVVAVPRETELQSRHRAIMTSVAGKQETRQMSLALVSPPLVVEGIAHVSAGAGARNSINVFSKFFSLTGATLSLPANPDREFDVVLVSRDHVVAMSEIPAPKLAQAV